jgi:hypothetical protein
MARSPLARAEMTAAGVSGIAALLMRNEMSRLDGQAAFPDDNDATRPFKPHYDAHILPDVQRFEVDRLAALSTFRGRIFLGAPALVAVAVLAVTLLAMIGGGEDFILFGAFAIGALIVGWIVHPVATYKAGVKSVIFPKIFSFFGPDYHYSPSGGLQIGSLKPSGILPSYDNSSTEDYVRGRHNGVGIELTEAKLTERRGSGKRRSTVTVFSGIFVLLEMNKRFSGKTIVKRDQGMIGNWFSSKISDMEAVRLEDPVFEKQFEVSSTDQVEARYLLTTSFMERLLKLAALIGDGKLQCSFYDNKLLIMVPSSHDRFETSSIFKPSTFVEDIHTIIEEMREIFAIVDMLKLHERTGL